MTTFYVIVLIVAVLWAIYNMLLVKIGQAMGTINRYGRPYASESSGNRIVLLGDNPPPRGYKTYLRHHTVCFWCGSVPSTVVDHVVPVKHGGRDDTTNLVGACSKCNGSKSAKNPYSYYLQRNPHKIFEGFDEFEKLIDIHMEETLRQFYLSDEFLKKK